MPVAIVGMHRSGTSMVAHLLNRTGLHLGHEAELLGPRPDNPDGYWEHIGFHRLNEWVLAELGGGWNDPPVLPRRWREDRRLRRFDTEARRIISDIGSEEPWGWKDPRTSITLPLWTDLIPDLKVVVCVRNPLEVAFSLNRRGMYSYSSGLKLWRIYNERILEASADQQRIVTQYSTYFTRPREELERVLSHVGITASPQALGEAVEVCRRDLRHIRFDLTDMVEARVSSDIVDLYKLLTETGSRAKAAAPGTSAGRTARSRAARIVDEDEVERRAALQELPSLSEVPSLMRELEHLRAAVRRRDQALARSRRRESELTEENRLAGERGLTHDALVRAVAGLQDSFFTLDAEVQSGFAEGHSTYTEQVHRAKAMVRRETSLGARIAVVSKGDDRLLGLYGRVGMHFPQQDDGTAIGHHLGSSLSLIAHLEVVRSRGAQYLLLPAPSLWWLEHYPDFRRHLVTRFCQVRWDSDAGALFALAPSSSARGRRRATIVEIVAATRSHLGRSPTVLDWHTGLDLVNALSGAQHLAPAPERGALPYPDASIDVVVLTSSDSASVREAARVAGAVSVSFPTGSEGSAGPAIDLKLPREALAVRDVAIVVDVVDQPADTEGFLISLAESLPQGFHGEIVFVDRAASDSGRSAVDRFAETCGPTVVIRTASRLRDMPAANLGAELVTAELLILLRTDALLLPNWLRPLRDLLHERSTAGAVGGAVLASDGSLIQAGGTVFRDGSALSVGYGHANPAASDFDYVRPVDFCSRRILATRRQAFVELGGFQSRLPVGYHDVDYCMRLRSQGLEVYFQPSAAVVDRHGPAHDLPSTGGLQPPLTGSPAGLTRRWRSMLKGQPERPEVLGFAASANQANASEL